MIIPESPERFFLELLPALFAAQLGAVEPDPAGARPRREPSGAGVVARVVGAGEWTLRLVERELRVTPGVAPDAALQLSLRAEDFVPLVVEPMRRALAAEEGAPGAALAARSLWARLGRFDEETAELLRRQEGRILIRVEDAGTPRVVALTPGTAEWSLDSAECFIDCELTALHEVQARRTNPLDLFYDGHIRITGDAKIALAMAGLFL